MPNTLEKVRATMTLGSANARGMAVLYDGSSTYSWYASSIRM